VRCAATLLSIVPLIPNNALELTVGAVGRVSGRSTKSLGLMIEKHGGATQ